MEHQAENPSGKSKRPAEKTKPARAERRDSESVVKCIGAQRRPTPAPRLREEHAGMGGRRSKKKSIRRGKTEGLTRKGVNGADGGGEDHGTSKGENPRKGLLGGGRDTEDSENRRL